MLEKYMIFVQEAGMEILASTRDVQRWVRHIKNISQDEKI